MVSVRRGAIVAPRMRSAWPYIGEESTKVAPVSRATSVIAWRVASPGGTSTFLDVPMPMTGTVMPANGRCSMVLLRADALDELDDAGHEGVAVVTLELLPRRQRRGVDHAVEEQP